MLMPKSQSSQTVSHPPSKSLFQSDLEQRYFRIFCDKISRELSGLFDSTLWSRIVLQAVENDPGIRHIVIAIGALGFTSKVVASRLPLLSDSSDQALKLFHDEIQKHHHLALKQYAIAIRLLRKSASERKNDVRTMILGCVLTACFETFHGDHESAIAQIQSGLNLVEEWHKGNKNTKGTDNLLGTTSPSPYTIEDELMQALGRLDIQAMSFLDPRDQNTHERMRHYGQTSIDAMPTSFQGVKEARVYLELVMRRFMHFVSLLSSVEGVDGCLRNKKCFTSFPVSFKNNRMKYVEELERWHCAFLPLLEYARRPEGHRDLLGATTLEAHYLSSYFALDMISFEPTASTKSHTALFKEVLSLCKFIIRHPDVKAADAKYHFDLHILPPLYIVGLRCRHSGTRREAVALLLSSPRREGVWDGILVGKIVQWIVDLEEEDGLDADFMLIGKGVVDLRFDFDLQSRSVLVHCLQLKEGVENPVERDAVITW
jgi:hypothetical protein